MITDADWEGGDLTAARRSLTAEQSVWDGHWRRWWLRAVESGRHPNDAVKIAYTRTEDQYGKRPEPKEKP